MQKAITGTAVQAQHWVLEHVVCREGNPIAVSVICTQRGQVHAHHHLSYMRVGVILFLPDLVFLWDNQSCFSSFAPLRSRQYHFLRLAASHLLLRLPYKECIVSSIPVNLSLFFPLSSPEPPESPLCTEDEWRIFIAADDGGGGIPRPRNCLGIITYKRKK